MADQKTFIIDCPTCSAKVAAVVQGTAKRIGWDDEASEPFGERILSGNCPHCETLVVGRQTQTRFDGYEGEEEDRFTDVVRIFPKPPKVFSSHRIPGVLISSLNEGDRVLQIGANVAACVMFGRALEALCRDVIDAHEAAGGMTAPQSTKKKHIMLDQGIKRLRELKVIDDRLYDWSQHLKAFRNLAAHASDLSLTRTEAEDLQAFVHAITEYVYDLADRHDEFKAREEEKKKPKKSAAEMFSGVKVVHPFTPRPAETAPAPPIAPEKA